jgi:SPP1 gp7 family putative phage head morphogenesis protein
MAEEPTANEELLDRVIRHQVYLERFKGTELKRLIKVLDELDKDLTAQLADSDPETWKGRRLEAQVRKVEEISDEAVKRYDAELTGTLEELAVYEGAWGASAVAGAMGAEILVKVGMDIITPDPNLLRAAVSSRPLQGRLLKDWVADMGAARRGRLAAAIRMAAIENQTIQQLIQRIRGTRAHDFKDGILDISRRGAEGIARTAIQHISNEARRMSYEQNKAVINEIQWVSTLDGRTTPFCRAMDGKRFPLDKGPRPPAHINCRSTTIPVLISWEEIGIEAGEISEGTRASMNGQVPDTLDYDGWLRKQPTEFQDDVLGKGKAELFRNGLKMDRFVDLKTQHAFTMAELMEREPAIWEATFGGTAKRAGLNPDSLGAPELPPELTPKSVVGGLQDTELQQLADRADKALEAVAPEAERAIAEFIGHRPLARDDDFGTGFGLMSARTLEEAVRDGGPIMEALARELRPVKDYLQAHHGDTLTLYRVQSPVEDVTENVINMSRAADGSRRVLSWTSDLKFAEYHAGVPRHVNEPIGPKAIEKLEAEFAEQGKVAIPGTRYTLELEQMEVPVPGSGPPGIFPYNYPDQFKWTKIDVIQIYQSGDHITDTDSVAKFIEGINRERLERAAAAAEARKLIVTAPVKLDDVIWVSDRAGQSEFVVLNTPGTPQYIDMKGVHRPGGADTLAAPGEIVPWDSIRPWMVRRTESDETLLTLVQPELVAHPTAGAAIKIIPQTVGMDEWPDKSTGIRVPIFRDEAARDAFLARLPADKRELFRPAEIRARTLFGQGQPMIAELGDGVVLANGSDLMLEELVVYARDAGGYMVGARELYGFRASRLPDPVGKHASLEQAEKALKKYFEAAIDDKHDGTQRYSHSMLGSYEHLAAVDINDGEVLFRTTDNNVGSAGLPLGWNGDGARERSLDIWHNHPSVLSPLSEQDIYFTSIRPYIRDIVAHDALGNVFRGRPWLTQDKADWFDLNQHIAAVRATVWRAFDQAVREEFEELTPLFAPYSEAGNFRRHLQWGYANHLTWRLLDALGMLRYRYELVGLARELDDVLDAILREEGMTIIDLAESLSPAIGIRLDEVRDYIALTKGRLR